MQVYNFDQWFKEKGIKKNLKETSCNGDGV